MIKVNLKTFEIAFGRLTILCFLLSFYFPFIVEGFTGNTAFRTLFLIFAFLFYALKIGLNSKLHISRIFLAYALLAIPIAVVSAIFWFSLGGLNVYFTLITAIVIITADFEFFKKMIKYIAYLLLGLTIYEFLTKTYVFFVVRETPWGLKPLDPAFYGGYAKIFRAKGLFEGPLALAQFAIGLGILFKSELRIIIIALILSVLANGRLGMLFCALVLIMYFINKYGVLAFIKNRKGLQITLLTGFGMLFFGAFFISDKALNRILKVFSDEDGGNQARIYYWDKALELFSDYNLFHKIFGNSGFYRDLIGNSAENGWLMLLLDNGILGLLYYFMPLFVIFWISLSKNTSHFVYILILGVAMVVQTFHLGVSASLFYWLIVYVFYLELNKEKTYESV